MTTYGLCTYAKLDRDREKVAASLLGDLLAAGHTRQVHEAGLNKTLLAFGSLENLLGETVIMLASWKTQSIPLLTGNRRRP